MNYGTPESRKALKAYYRSANQAFEQWRSAGFAHGDTPAQVSYPEICRGMLCGAKTRAGTRCKNSNLHANGRCKFHGGLSTGPKTTEGKQRSALNGHVPKRQANPMED